MIRRGDIVLVALPGDLGKPRPALVVQSDAFNETHATVTLVPFSSHLTALSLFRIEVEASAETGLRQPSQAMIDKVTSHRREKLGQVIGRAGEEAMSRVDQALLLWLGLPGPL